MKRMFSKKNINDIKDLHESGTLNKHLGAFDLILFGIGAIVGTGVFVVSGMVAANYSGPAIMVSYAIGGVVCMLVGLVYAEVASMLPTSGSIYTYSYIAFGEIFAWLALSIVSLELTVGSAIVTVGWSAYVQGLLSSIGVMIPKALAKGPSDGGIINLPAMLITWIISIVLYLGTKSSKSLIKSLVWIKLSAIFVFMVVAIKYFDINNWSNFVPFGGSNVIRGASILFFAFTGFGVIATTGEECRNPERDIKIGIIGSLCIATTIYIVMLGILTGIVPFTELDNPEPMAHALRAKGSQIGGAIVATGAMCGMTTVLMMSIYGQSRVLYAIARDGMLPKSFAKLHHKFKSPSFALFVIAVLVSILAGVCPYGFLGQFASMGALIDYIVIGIIALVFRVKYPNYHRPFKCPMIFITAPLSGIVCFYLLLKQIFNDNWEVQGVGIGITVWFIIVIILYFVRLKFRSN